MKFNITSFLVFFFLVNIVIDAFPNKSCGQITSGETDLPVSVTITPSANPVCSGTAVTFTAGVENGGSNPVYQWYVNGILVSGPMTCNMLTEGLVACYPFNRNADDETGSGNNGTVHGATLTSDRYGNPNSAYSFNGSDNYIVMDADNLPATDRTVSLWFNAISLATHPVPFAYGGQYCGQTWFESLNHGGPLYVLESHCEGNLIEHPYTQEPVGEWYHWVISTNPAGSKMYINGALVATDGTYVDDTYVSGKDMAVGVCVSPVGYAPYIDGNVGYFYGKIDDIRVYNRALSDAEVLLLYNNSNNTYTYVPSDGDEIYCVVTSDDSTATNNPDTSNVVVMTVNPVVTVGITISPDPPEPVCQGSPVTLTAVPVNGGASPVFQWLINGSPVSGETGISFTSATLNNGDQIQCVLTSSEACPVGNPATSAPVFMAVDPVLPVSITISSAQNPVCAGIQVTYTATPVNPGSTPSYEWRVNGVPAGSGMPAYQYIPVNGDLIICNLTSSETCATGNPATSNEIAMTVLPVPQVSITPCNDLITTTTARPFRMKGGLPLGGIYSGPGIDPAAGFFNPSFAAEGPNIVTYTYTNNDLCSSSGFITIQVFPSPGFTCGNDLTDIRDNQTYSTFSLPGGKCWMAANMNFGNQIPAVQYQADNCQVEKYCSGDSLVNCNLYGGLYQWDEAMQYEITSQSNGICPPGWHIPNSADWEGLIDFYGTAGLAGDPMKDLSNPAGFRALLHGIYYFNSTWYLSGGPYKAAMYWSSTTDGNLRSLARGVNHHTQSVSLYSSLKNNAMAVRCVRD